MFRSYAQVLEDVRLWRALSSVGTGAYVDVGAFHPFDHSVTAGFYERGWRGVNIEPLGESLAAFERDRPRDLNLRIGMGEAPGRLAFYTVFPPGDRGARQLSTFDRGVAEHHRRQGFTVVEEAVPVRPLDDVLDEAALGEIHFLKIDVEGFELPVLKGLALRRHRPWIIVIEATYPNSDTPTHAAWEPLLLAGGYRFVYFDGLNRYYVREDKKPLAFGIVAPFDTIDDFVSRVQIQARLPHCFEQLADLVGFLRSGLVGEADRERVVTLARQAIEASS